VTQQEHLFTTNNIRIERLPYLLHLPPGMDKARKGTRWPLILFLHGMGERGGDLKAIRTQGLAARLEKDDSLPFIVVSPQCPLDSWWDLHLDTLSQMVDKMVTTYPVDPQRVYLTGLSMGGYGTWALAAKRPDQFAAIAPICGGLMFWHDLDTEAPRLKDMPVWAFHGTDDETVPPVESQRVVEAVRAAGNDRVYMTLYPGVGHNSWTQTYDNPELYAWFNRYTLE
jgi:predicted peptidase